MPTYDYKCEACGHEFEQFQSITAASLKKCPKCGKSKLKRLIGTGAGLIFKGSGFYITDYRSEGYKSAAKSDAAPSTAGIAEVCAPEGIVGCLHAGSRIILQRASLAPQHIVGGINDSVPVVVDVGWYEVQNYGRGP